MCMRSASDVTDEQCGLPVRTFGRAAVAHAGSDSPSSSFTLCPENLLIFPHPRLIRAAVRESPARAPPERNFFGSGKIKGKVLILCASFGAYSPSIICAIYSLFCCFNFLVGVLGVKLRAHFAPRRRSAAVQRHHGERRGAHLQRGAVSRGPVRAELHLATRLVGRLQLHPQRDLGRGTRTTVTHHPHHRRRVLGGVRGGLGGELSSDVCHH